MFHAKCTINSSLLGEGSAGKVYRGKYGTIWYRRSVAVKVFDLSNPLGAYAFQREASAHALIKKLGTRYFVKVYSISQTLTTGKIVMQLYDQDLFDYLNTAGDSESVLRPIFRDVCLGVKLLHKDGIAHLDLKPENILMAGNKPHIADYGAVCAQEQPDQPFIPTNSFRGTILYAGPEISSNMYFNPYCADIYSLGVMFHTCLAGVFPFHASPPVLELSFAQQTLSAEAYDLVSKMLTTSPLARPTIDEILSHPWFRIGQ